MIIWKHQGYQRAS